MRALLPKAWVLLLFYSLPLAAQVPAAPLPESSDVRQPSAAEPASGEAVSMKGDRITFKNGKVLAGVQILRETLTGVEIQMLGGLPPFKLPKDQIESIQYDDIDPNKPTGLPTPVAPGVPGVLIAKELSPELSRKLATPLLPEDLRLEGLSILGSLAALSESMEVPLVIAEPVHQRDQTQQLVWPDNPPPNSTFSSLLQDQVVKNFPELAVVYEYNQVVLTTRATTPENAATAEELEPGLQ